MPAIIDQTQCRDASHGQPASGRPSKDNRSCNAAYGNADPPARGVAAVWLLPLLGWSTKPTVGPYATMRRPKPKAIRHAAQISKINLGSQLPVCTGDQNTLEIRLRIPGSPIWQRSWAANAAPEAEMIHSTSPLRNASPQ